MNCAEVRILLAALTDGEIADDRLREKLQSHLDGCEECRREYAMQLEMKSKVSELEPEMASDSLATRIIAEISQRRRGRTIWRRCYAWAGSTAVVALLAILGATLFVHPSAPGVYKSLPETAPAPLVLSRSSDLNQYENVSELIMTRHDEARELLKVRDEWTPELEQIVQRLGGEEDDGKLYKELPEENVEDEEESVVKEE
jgi:hypothetical protein